MSVVIFEDNHCLAFDKPAGLLTQGDQTGDRCLLDEARDYLREKYRKPGNVFVGLVHRLDRPTSGVVLLARTSKAAARLSEQFRDGTVEKTYLAVVEGDLREAEGEWDDWLRKDERRNVVEVVPEGTARSLPARLGFRVVEARRGLSVVELRPITGRSHQLRVQLAARGFPIVGDRKYGASRPLLARDGLPRVALHALSLTFNHPTSRGATSLSAPVPADWPA